MEILPRAEVYQKLPITDKVPVPRRDRRQKPIESGTLPPSKRVVYRDRQEIQTQFPDLIGNRALGRE